MTNRVSILGRRGAERGEGRLKLVLWLLVLAYVI
jgi:hypothetical protein